MDKPTLRERIVDLLDIGDTDFDREGGYTPARDFAEEQATQILNLLKEELEGLTIIGDEEIEKYMYDTFAEDWEKGGHIAQAQLSHTIKELKAKLGG